MNSVFFKTQLTLFRPKNSIGFEKRLNSCEKMSKICKIILSADVFTSKQNLGKHSTVHFFSCIHFFLVANGIRRVPEMGSMQGQNSTSVSAEEHDIKKWGEMCTKMNGCNATTGNHPEPRNADSTNGDSNNNHSESGTAATVVDSSGNGNNAAVLPDMDFSN